LISYNDNELSVMWYIDGMVERIHNARSTD